LVLTNYLLNFCLAQTSLPVYPPKEGWQGRNDPAKAAGQAAMN
jgi:hypothetical protein